MCLLDLCLVPGYSSVKWLPDRRVAVKTDLAGAWEVLSPREWAVLQHACSSRDPIDAAVRSTTVLRRGLGAENWCEALDDLPGPVVGALLSINPRVRAVRNELRSVTSSEVARLIERFIDARLLVQMPTEHAGHTPDSAIDVSVTTANRPEALQRILTQLSSDVRAHAEPLVVRVFDNSGSSEAQQQNAELCASLDNGPMRVMHVGETAREKLFRHLVSRGIDARSARFALWGLNNPRIGANRNMALLSSAGRRLLMLDDDVIPRVWLPEVRQAGITLTPERRPRTFGFALRTSDLFRGLHRSDQPIWRAHSRVLGRSISATVLAAGLNEVVSAAVPTDPSWGTLCAHGRVRASLHGFIGDSGMGWQRLLLVLDEPARTELVCDASRYNATCATGQLRSVAATTLLSPFGTGPTGGMGVDATDLMPPFTPSLRCEDVLFLEVLRKLDSPSVLAFVPEAIEHWPIEDRSKTSAPIWAETGVRLYSLLKLVVTTGCGDLSGLESAARLRRVARVFEDAGNARPSELRALLRQVWLQHVAWWMDATERALSESASKAPWWADDVARFRHKLIADCSVDEATLPRDLGETAGPPLDYVRTMFLELAQLYEAWPDMWRAAREYDGYASRL